MTPKEKDAEHSRKYRENNVEKLREYRRRRYLLNGEKMRAERNTDENRRKRRERYWRDPERWRKIALEDGKKNPERRRATANAWYGRTPALQMLRHARARARRLGLPIDIKVEDLVVPATCPVLGIPMEIGVGSSHDGSPTIDRLIPSLGYVMGNVRVISYRANRIKNDATLDELRALVAYLEREIG